MCVMFLVGGNYYVAMYIYVYIGTVAPLGDSIRVVSGLMSGSGTCTNLSDTYTCILSDI